MRTRTSLDRMAMSSLSRSSDQESSVPSEFRRVLCLRIDDVLLICARPHRTVPTSDSSCSTWMYPVLT
jgi:hypothetical protein